MALLWPASHAPRPRLTPFSPQIVSSASTDLQDYTYYFVPAPWLSVKLLRLLQCYPPPGTARPARVRAGVCLGVFLGWLLLRGPAPQLWQGAAVSPDPARRALGPACSSGWEQHGARSPACVAQGRTRRWCSWVPRCGQGLFEAAFLLSLT